MGLSLKTSTARRADFIAVTSIGVVLSVTIGALFFFWAELRHAKATLTAEGGFASDNLRLRDGAMALLDLSRLQKAIALALTSEAGLEGARPDFEQALDLLYVRMEAYAFNLSLSDPSEGSEAAQAEDVTQRLKQIIDFGDALLSNGTDSITTASTTLQRKIETAVIAISQQYDTRNRAHHKLMMAQGSALNRLTKLLTVLLTLASGISILALLLWWSEIRARERRRAAEDEAHFLAYHDALTGLPNRSQFHQDVDRIIAKHPNPAMIMIDLDDFKGINDRFGHPIGDLSLKATAQRLVDGFGSQQGRVARLGGDEFAVILPNLEGRDALAELCQEVVTACRIPVDTPEGLIPTSASMGIAFLENADPGPNSAAALFRAADYALYRAKAAGRDTFRFYDVDMARQVDERRKIRDALPGALANEDFFVVFQPQIDMKSLEVHGFEALVRWQCDGAIVPPSNFISVAEESGIITEIDLWVLRRALHEAAEWGAHVPHPFKVSVNLSAVDFRDASIIDRVAAVLDGSVIAPDRVTLEITESVFIEDWRKTSRIIEGLAGLGVSLALDDFGTGYSSMSYLRLLDVSEVKIDRSFVTDIETSMQTRMIVDALVELVASLNMTLVVEGMETQRQADLLRDLGAGIGQGYYFGKPMPGTEALAWLIEHDSGSRAAPFTPTGSTVLQRA